MNSKKKTKKSEESGSKVSGFFGKRKKSDAAKDVKANSLVPEFAKCLPPTHIQKVGTQMEWVVEAKEEKGKKVRNYYRILRLYESPDIHVQYI